MMMNCNKCGMIRNGTKMMTENGRPWWWDDEDEFHEDEMEDFFDDEDFDDE